MIGAGIVRIEDERFLRGEGRYLADLRAPFMLEAVVVRSPLPHALIKSMDCAAAAAHSGVAAIITAADLPAGVPPIPCRIPTHGDLSPYLQHVLASERVRYVGEPFAVVVATSRAIAEDAAELIEVDWEPLPVVADAAAGLQPNSEPLHAASNVAGRWGFDLGEVDVALRTASAVVSESFSIQRHTAMPLETRGLLALYDHGRNLLEVHGPTKVPHTNRNLLSGMLGIAEANIRMIEPDVGGSFGARGEFYPEDFLIPFLAVRLRRPVRWVEDRLEHFASINHSREAKFEVTAAADRDGIITAFDVKLVADMGAYIRTHGDVVPSHAAAQFPGPYRVRNYRIDVATVMSNKTPTGTMRAPGMFEANFARERTLDKLAAALGIAPLELRRRNLIRKEDMPWAVGTESVKRPTVFDSGDFASVLSEAIEAYRWNAPFERQAGALRRGRGLALLVEPSGLGPFEGVRIEIDQRGNVTVFSGSSNQGQGHETVLAQIAAEILKVPLKRISVRHGDTGLIPYGGGSYASRTAVLAGNATFDAATAVKNKALAAAADKLKVGAQALELTEIGIRQRGGDHGSPLTLGDVARMLMPGNTELLPSPKNHQIADHDGLAATAYVRGVPAGTSAFAVHMADVLVDVETGETKVERYLVACDLGRVINSSIVRGQLVGGVVQGLGGTFLEELAYDSEGQLTTGTFADYLLPSVFDAPPIETLVLERVPAPGNRLGVKGVGEIGPSGVAAAIGNAIANALCSVSGLNRLPLTPERILQSTAGGAS